MGVAVATPRFLTAASVCLGIAMLAGLISLRPYHADDERFAPTRRPTDHVPIAVQPPEDLGTRATLLDDLMLGALIVALAACAVFVWLNLPRFMATG